MAAKKKARKTKKKTIRTKKKKSLTPYYEAMNARELRQEIDNILHVDDTHHNADPIVPNGASSEDHIFDAHPYSIFPQEVPEKPKMSDPFVMEQLRGLLKAVEAGRAESAKSKPWWKFW